MSRSCDAVQNINKIRKPALKTEPRCNTIQYKDKLFKVQTDKLHFLNRFTFTFNNRQ